MQRLAAAIAFRIATALATAFATAFATTRAAPSVKALFAGERVALLTISDIVIAGTIAIATLPAAATIATVLAAAVSTALAATLAATHTTVTVTASVTTIVPAAIGTKTSAEAAGAARVCGRCFVFSGLRCDFVVARRAHRDCIRHRVRRVLWLSVPSFATVLAGFFQNRPRRQCRR